MISPHTPTNKLIKDLNRLEAVEGDPAKTFSFHRKNIQNHILRIGHFSIKEHKMKLREKGDYKRRLDVWGVDNLDTVALLSQKGSQKSLQRIEFRINYGMERTDEVLSQAVQRLKLFSSLRHLTLRFKSWTNITDASILGLSHGLKALSALETIYFRLDNCSQVTNKGIKHFSQSLKYLKCLNDLYIKIKQSGSDLSNGLESLGKEFKTYLH